MKFLKALLNDLKLVAGNEGGWAWAIPAGMAVLGYMQGEDQKAQARAQNKAAAVQTQFSPWTKMGAGRTVSEGSGGLGGAIQGGLAGMGMMQNFNAANATASGAKTPQNAQPQMISGPNEQMVQQQQNANQLYQGSYQPKQNTWSSMYA
jgi:hypothetical protein